MRRLVMARRLSFHVQQNLTPGRLRAIVYAGADGIVDAEQLAMNCGFRVSVLEKVVLPFVRQLGLLHTSGMLLTESGRGFYKLAWQFPTLFAEAMHILLYTAHTFDSTKRFSWAYARVVDTLWTRSDCVLDGRAKGELVGLIVEEASKEFGMPLEEIAFSHHSIRGVLNWLQGLEPPVVESAYKTDRFRRRHFCHPAVFLWAVDFIYRAHSTAHGVRVFLTPERIEQLCRVCLLDPSGLENVLMMTKRTSDYERGGEFDYGTGGGFGRWILLARPCPVPTLPDGS
jgi:hypothetical protein